MFSGCGGRKREERISQASGLVYRQKRKGTEGPFKTLIMLIVHVRGGGGGHWG